MIDTPSLLATGLDSPTAWPSTPPSSAAVTERVIVVDDDEAIRVAFGRFLRTKGYRVSLCESGPEALALLERERFQLMLCDVRLSEMTGLDVVPRALRLDPDLAILMLTGVDDAATATDALALGAFDYLVKPLDFARLLRALERATRRRQLEIDRRHVDRHVREEIALRTAELEHERRAVHELAVGVVESLINAMEAKDVYLRGHSRRVAEQAAAVAEALQLEPDVVENVRLAGRLQDVGKIGTREDVLNKPGPLTDEEVAHVRDHVRMGMEILAPLKHIPVVLQYVHDHHEQWNGSGYPRALSGEQITIGGRILAACDAFDALTSRRAYREAMSPSETIEYLEHCTGQQLDPFVFAALKKVVLRRNTLTFIDDVHA
ncbi:MAG: response regulator [Gemmatimonadaceae bacterium]|nr:response regulator [Gemmatimonadaceae bacterium]